MLQTRKRNKTRKRRRGEGHGEEGKRVEVKKEGTKIGEKMEKTGGVSRRWGREGGKIGGKSDDIPSNDTENASPSVI